MSMRVSDLRRLLAIGAGVGIEIGERDLRVTVARVRPHAARVLGGATIQGFRERAAAEWGQVYADFLRRAGAGHLSATVLLPRREVIVRQLALPGLSGRDLASSIQLQIDSLHPFAEGDVAWACGRLSGDGSVLVAVARHEAVERYRELFAEAGVKIAAFTVSAAAVYSALRLVSSPPAGFIALAESDGELEAYGESQARGIFSAALDLPGDKAAALASAELRLPPETEPLDLAAVLPRPVAAPADFDLSRNALAYAAALAGACPRLALPVNLLPPEYRSSHSRAIYVPTAALAVMLVIALAALASISPLEDRKYLTALQTEIAKLEPQARRAAALQGAIEAARGRARALDNFRLRSKADLDSLAELTRLVQTPTYLTSLELSRDAAMLNGLSEQAAPLLKLIDSSSKFGGSRFTVPLTRAGRFEMFRIRADRKEAFR